MSLKKVERVMLQKECQYLNSMSLLEVAVVDMNQNKPNFHLVQLKLDILLAANL